MRPSAKERAELKRRVGAGGEPPEGLFEVVHECPCCGVVHSQMLLKWRPGVTDVERVSMPCERCVGEVMGYFRKANASRRKERVVRFAEILREGDA